jgi:uncharacterized membrane protein required for colicin V production
VVSLVVLFWVFIILFGVIGAMRGWSKEVLVTSSLVMGLFLNAILGNYVSFYQNLLTSETASTQFILLTLPLVLLAFAGYQSPRLTALQGKLARERIEGILLGLVVGLLNGYLLVGSILFYLHATGYPTSLIAAPPEGSELAVQLQNMMGYMPPALLIIPYVYFAVAAISILIIVVFV